jgi:hypothetical protein
MWSLYRCHSVSRSSLVTFSLYRYRDIRYNWSKLLAKPPCVTPDKKQQTYASKA